MKRYLSSLALTTLGGTLLSLSSADVAQAVTFNFGNGDGGSSTIVKTVDDLTLTLSSPIPNSTFFADAKGFCLLRSNGLCTFDFDLSFSKAVQITSLTLDIADIATPFAANLKVEAGEVMSLSTSSNSLIRQVSAIEVTPLGGVNPPAPIATPEPGSLLGLLALGSLGFPSVLKRLKK